MLLKFKYYLIFSVTIIASDYTTTTFGNTSAVYLSSTESISASHGSPSLTKVMPPTDNTQESPVNSFFTSVNDWTFFLDKTNSDADNSSFDHFNTTQLFVIPKKPDTKIPVKFADTQQNPTGLQSFKEIPYASRVTTRKKSPTIWRSWLVYSNSCKQLMPRIASIPTIPKIFSLSLTRNLATDFAKNHVISNYPVETPNRVNKNLFEWTNKDTYQVCALIAHMILVIVIAFFASREIIFQLKLWAKNRRRSLRRYRS